MVKGSVRLPSYSVLLVWKQVNRSKIHAISWAVKTLWCLCDSSEMLLHITKTTSMFTSPKAELMSSGVSHIPTQLLVGQEGRELCCQPNSVHAFITPSLFGLFSLLAYTGLKNCIKEAKEKVFQRMKLRIVKIFE